MTIQQKQGVNSFWSSKTTHRCVIRCPHKVSYLVCVSGSFFSQKRTSTTSWWTNRKQLTRKLKNSRYNYTLKYTINMHIHVLPAVRVQVCQWCDCVVIIIIFFLQQKKVYLERSVKEAEDNIREMLMSRRTQWSFVYNQ